MAIFSCTDCNGCCIDVAAPKKLFISESCCFCGEETEILIAPNQVIAAGTILGEITGDANGNGAIPQTYKAFDKDATDGTQKAKVILKYDTCTDEKGQVTNWSGIWGCGRNTTKAYVCAKLDARQIVGDIEAARASGMPIRVINGWAYYG